MYIDQTDSIHMLCLNDDVLWSTEYRFNTQQYTYTVWVYDDDLYSTE